MPKEMINGELVDVTYGPIKTVVPQDSAAGSQQRSLDEAASYQEKMFQRQEEVLGPLIKMGTEQLGALKEGIESGAFSMDESLFQDYQTYVAPEYEPGGRFQYEPRENLMTPERFEYKQEAPDFNKYSTQQVQPFTPYQQQGQGQGPQFSPYQQGPAPQGRQIDSQFNTQQYRPGEAPQFYQAAEAPTAQYYDPNQEQYQSKKFNLQDDPVYQRRLEKSGEAIESSAAASGMQLSGATLNALQENAQGIAAEEGDAAYNRFRQDDQTAYNRFQDRQMQGQESSRYKNEDQYRRHLDTVGIRGVDADRAVQQFNIDRGFGAGQSSEMFNREQVSKQLGRELNDDEWRRYIDQRNFGQSSNLQNYGMARDAYTDTRNFGQAANIQNYQAGLQGQGQNWNQQFGQYGAETDQFNINRGFAAGQDQQNWQNQLNTYGVNNQNFADDRAFNYGVNQGYEGDRWNQYQYNNALRGQENMGQYGMLADAYGRQAANRAGQYGRIGDLVNIGTGAANTMAGNTQNYYDSLSNLGIERANVDAAYRSDLNNKSWWDTIRGN